MNCIESKQNAEVPIEMKMWFKSKRGDCESNGILYTLLDQHEPSSLFAHNDIATDEEYTSIHRRPSHLWRSHSSGFSVSKALQEHFGVPLLCESHSKPNKKQASGLFN